MTRSRIGFPVIILAMVAVMVLTAAAPWPVANSAAAAAAINVTDTSVKGSFPDSMAFNFQANSTSPINRVRVYYQVDRQNFAEVTSEAWPKFDASQTVKTNWIWDMRKGNLPPGASVKYWWTASNQAGETVATDPRTVVFEDTRYSWKKVDSGNIRLMWYRGTDQFASDLLKGGIEGLGRLEAETGVRLERNVRIYIYASSDDLLGALIFPNEWTGGVTYTEFGIIAIGVSTNQLNEGKRTVSHELGHVVINQLTYSPYASAMPLWLNEGIAQHAEGPVDLTQQSRLQRAIKQGSTISLRSLAGSFSANWEEALISYAESYAVVDYLMNNYPGEKVMALLKAFRTGSTADQALMDIYGMDQDGLYDAWLKSVRAAPTGIKSGQVN